MFSLVVLIDTNVLYHALDYGIHIQSDLRTVIDRDFEVYVHSKVEEEIIRDLTLDNKRGRKAKLAIQLVRDLETYEDPREYEGTDVALLKTAKRVNGVVFTFDKELRNRCKKENIPVITNYTRGKLQLVGFID